jgi:histidyl-tRNA synthetase
MAIQAPKGTRDLVGAEVASFWELEKAARRVFELYEFEELRTPIFESAELFSRSLGETSDVVEKEMFTFSDRGERTFSLRPEGTAGVVRHFIENNLAVKGGLHRFFYMGPMFRAERPQAGRYRQFSQIGSEYFGAADAAADAETVIMVSQILRAFGIFDFTVHVNSIGDSECRPRYRDALLAYLKQREGELTEESRRRMSTNPLRVLDSKVDGPKLIDAPVLLDYLNEDCRQHHALFLTLLKDAGIPIHENPRLVRGLDYYTRSVFEFVSPNLGAQSALAAGGRYDDLVSLLGGPKTPGVGFALGMDRLVAARPRPASVAASDAKKAVVIPFMNEAVPACVRVAQALRADGIAVPPVAVGKKLKTQLAHAVDSGANWAILIGEDELKTQTASVKNLANREQSSVPLDSVAAHIKNFGGR